MLILGSIKKCAAAVDKKATQFANTAKQVLSKYKLSPKSKRTETPGWTQEDFDRVAKPNPFHNPLDNFPSPVVARTHPVSPTPTADRPYVRTIYDGTQVLCEPLPSQYKYDHLLSVEEIVNKELQANQLSMACFRAAKQRPTPTPSVVVALEPAFDEFKIVQSASFTTPASSPATSFSSLPSLSSNRSSSLNSLGPASPPSATASLPAELVKSVNLVNAVVSV